MFDSFLKIGSSHSICEDYCLVKQDVAILCDGCSSSKHTDVGARLIAHAYYGTPNPRNILGGVFGQAFGISKQLEIGKEALICTLNTMYVNYDKIYIHMYGDGICYIKRKNLEGEIIHIDYNNAPYYYYYNHFGLREIYNKAFGEPTPIINGVRGEVIKDREPSYSICLDVSTIEYVLIFSDGICSFNKPYVDMLKELVQFKGLQGQFIQRRLKYLFKHEWKEYIHSDDLGILGWANV